MSHPEGTAEFTLKAVVTGVLLGSSSGRQTPTWAAGRDDGLGVDPGRGDDGRRVPALPLAGHDPGGEPLADRGLGLDGARHRHHLHDPRLFLWGMVPPYLQVVALAFLAACSACRR